MSDSDLKIKPRSIKGLTPDKIKIKSQFETITETDEPKHLASYTEKHVI
jgi:hypothetical protein